MVLVRLNSERNLSWNELTILWNDLTWNDLTMERNDRKSTLLGIKVTLWLRATIFPITRVQPD